MTTSRTTAELRFEPPGPGSWQQDPVHFPRPMTRYFQETHPAAFRKGTGDLARFYGMLIDGLQIGYVNGFGYNQVLPSRSPDGARSLRSPCRFPTSPTNEAACPAGWETDTGHKARSHSRSDADPAL